MRKKLKCPLCKKRVIDAGPTVKSEVRVVEPDENWEADYYTKCRCCKNEIGLKKTI